MLLNKHFMRLKGILDTTVDADWKYGHACGIKVNFTL